MNELCKLHVRWWHATVTAMTRMLRGAGCGQTILSQIPDIVSTCRELRPWQKTGPDPTTSLSLSTRQNEYVEGDILFYKMFMIWHMIDRADKFHMAVIIADKTGSTLVSAIRDCWIKMLGPFKFLVVD